MGSGEDVTTGESDAWVEGDTDTVGELLTPGDDGAAASGSAAQLEIASATARTAATGR